MRMSQQQRRPQIPTPEVDPENVEFVLFVRNAKVCNANIKCTADMVIHVM